MKQRKIYFLTFGDIPFDQRMQRIWSSLHGAGLEIEVIGRNLTKISVDEFPYKIKRFSPIFKSGILAYAEFNLRSFFYLIGRKFSCLSCVDLDTLITGRFLKYFKNFELVYDAHEYYTESPEIVDRPRVKAFWEKIADTCIPKVNHAYTVSQSIADEMTERYHVDFQLVRNLPYKSHEPEHDIHKVEAYILYQGALNLGRGLEQLIISMINVDGKKLYLAGEGDLKQHLTDLTESHGLEDKVIFLGNIPPQRLKEITLKAWLGVNLLENRGKSYYYSLANKFFDYIQCGIPQLCIDFPEYNTLNKQYDVALLLSDIHPDNISRAINQLSDDQILYKTLALNTIKASQDLNWENESIALIEIYRNIKI